MDLWSKGILKPLLVPGAALLLAAVILLAGNLVPLNASAIHFYYYAVFAAATLLAWRFHSSRILFALLALFLAQRALEFFSGGRPAADGVGHIALEAVALLLPLDFVIFSFMRERGLAIPTVAPGLGLLFVEAVFVAVICRPGETAAPAFLHPALFDPQLFHWTRLPQLAWLAFAAALGVLLSRFLLYRKPAESALLWSLTAAFLGLQAGGIGRRASAYVATGGLILAVSIIENSYALAYRDELTTLPSRRAFNDALLRLAEPYTVAMVDIDHFKMFNDTYGHDIGDQVLRMVASRLDCVEGGGAAFRVGGEEFCILFAGKSMKETLPHLELLRSQIEDSEFRIRGGQERRRSVSRGSDRRKPIARKTVRRRSVRTPSRSGELSVTVSIGVAEATLRTRQSEQVIQAADKALYRAKQAGRNRVETAAADRARANRNIA